MFRRALAVVLLALLVGSSLSIASAQADERCFSETNQCISGRFRQYWELNGGLPVFGYPVTAVVDAINPDTNKPYQLQWFERNRFELHTENAAPYDVLLGRLGDDRLKQLGKEWQTLPQIGPRDGCFFFQETGHSLCQPFRTYWETHGLQNPGMEPRSRSLALFGLPISSEMMETNTSGDTVITQWFERARFECHPSNPPGFQVLLGLLGNEVQQNPAIPAAKPATLCTVTTPMPDQPPAPGPNLPPPSFNNCQADPNPGATPNAPVRIISVNKSSEVVTLRNVSSAAVSIDGWHLCSITGNQEHPGIGGTLAPGESRAFPNTGGNIWLNSDRDDAALYNERGQLVSYLADR